MATFVVSLGSLNATIYMVIMNKAGQFWNGAAFEAFNAAHWASQYAISVPQVGADTGVYRVAYPAAFVAPAVPAGQYFLFVYRMDYAVGGAPAGTPVPKDSKRRIQRIQWDGTDEVNGVQTQAGFFGHMLRQDHASAVVNTTKVYDIFKRDGTAQGTVTDTFDANNLLIERTVTLT